MRQHCWSSNGNHVTLMGQCDTDCSYIGHQTQVPLFSTRTYSDCGDLSPLRCCWALEQNIHFKHNTLPSLPRSKVLRFYRNINTDRWTAFLWRAPCCLNRLCVGGWHDLIHHSAGAMQEPNACQCDACFNLRIVQNMTRVEWVWKGSYVLSQQKIGQWWITAYQSTLTH